jgi:hypothetical protein
MLLLPLALPEKILPLLLPPQQLLLLPRLPEPLLMPPGLPPPLLLPLIRKLHATSSIAAMRRLRALRVSSWRKTRVAVAFAVCLEQQPFMYCVAELCSQPLSRPPHSE